MIQHNYELQDLLVEFAKAKAEIERLRNIIDNRNEFIAGKGLWKELGQYLSSGGLK